MRDFKCPTSGASHRGTAVPAHECGANGAVCSAVIARAGRNHAGWCRSSRAVATWFQAIIPRSPGAWYSPRVVIPRGIS